MPDLSTCMNTVNEGHIISVCLFCAQKYRRQQRHKAKRRRRVEIEEIKILYIEHETYQ